MKAITADSLTKRAYPLRYHPEQARLWLSQARFNVVPAGRRSGKTEIVGKRKLVLKALQGTKYPDPRFFAAAPTRDQAKRIFWTDLKAMVPRHFLLGKPIETALVIPLINNAEIHVLGMDKPERIEGVPWDGGVLDEIANMKERVWTEHVRPALSDRQGWCDFIGVPEGRNHYFKLYKRARALAMKALKEGKIPIWDAFWWISADILPPEEIEEAKEDLDELTYKQEYEADFINFTGRAYYNYMEDSHARILNYDSGGDLIISFDFNVAPGVAAIGQEQQLPNKQIGTGWIGEVWIPRGSNTELVCNRIIKDWKEHKGRVFCYGDSTGGAKGSAKLLGSDWQIIKDMLRPIFGNRIWFKVPKANPRERDRVNAVNSRLKNTKGEVRMMVDPIKCPHVAEDLEGVILVEGGSGEIDKKSDETLTHVSDAVGYYVSREFPVKKRYAVSTKKYWK